MQDTFLKLESFCAVWVQHLWWDMVHRWLVRDTHNLACLLVDSRKLNTFVLSHSLCPQRSRASHACRPVYAFLPLMVPISKLIYGDFSTYKVLPHAVCART